MVQIAPSIEQLAVSIIGIIIPFKRGGVMV